MPRNRKRWRALALTTVLLGHTAVFLAVLRADRDRRITALPTERAAPMLIRLAARIPGSPPPPPVRPRTTGEGAARLLRPAPAELTPSPPEAAPPPRIDWARAAELAARNGMTNLEGAAGYRDLSALTSALTPAQREWLKRQELEPVRPGIRWKAPRVEVTGEGLPIIHLNEHCIIIPMLAFFMFCKIGHIEPNGHLFDHMREARKP